MRSEFLAPLASAGLLLEDRVLEHRLVKFEPDFLDMPRLFVAEQIARAANVEIVAGELEARAEAVEIGEHGQALVGAFGDHAIGCRRQICVGARLRPPDAPAQLV